MIATLHSGVYIFGGGIATVLLFCPVLAVIEARRAGRGSR